MDPERDGTPLLWAAVTGQAPAVELLISRGADLNAVDRDGGTALHAAAFLGHVKAVDVLVRKGASSAGLLPIPHVFAFYAIFFGFGAIYYGFDDQAGRVGERWWLPLSIALLIVLPLGLSLLQASSGTPVVPLGPLPRRILSIFLQSAYPWLMTFGLMGFFRRICSVESPAMRYLSDSACWLYLAHLPLISGAQYLVRDWPIPALAKFLLIVVVVTAFLLKTWCHLSRDRHARRAFQSMRGLRS